MLHVSSLLLPLVWVVAKCTMLPAALMPLAFWLCLYAILNTFVQSANLRAHIRRVSAVCSTTFEHPPWPRGTRTMRRLIYAGFDA